MNKTIVESVEAFTKEDIIKIHGAFDQIARIDFLNNYSFSIELLNKSAV